MRFIFLLCVFLVSSSFSYAFDNPHLNEIKFSELAITDELQETYPFIKQIIIEEKEFQEEFSSKRPLTIWSGQFSDPYSDRRFVILYFDSTPHCGINKCQTHIMEIISGQLPKQVLKVHTSMDIYTVTCNHQFSLFMAGGGFVYGYWTLDKDKFVFVRQVPEPEVDTLCREYNANNFI